MVHRSAFCRLLIALWLAMSFAALAAPARADLIPPPPTYVWFYLENQTGAAPRLQGAQLIGCKDAACTQAVVLCGGAAFFIMLGLLFLLIPRWLDPSAGFWLEKTPPPLLDRASQLRVDMELGVRTIVPPPFKHSCFSQNAEICAYADAYSELYPSVYSDWEIYFVLIGWCCLASPSAAGLAWLYTRRKK
jgi:hypothetical protein